MVRLAVANRAETYERIRDPLGDRGIDVEVASISAGRTSLGEPYVDPTRFDVGYVFPGRLMEGGVLDAALDIPWVNDREAILRSRNKAGVLARLERAGLPVPESVYVSNPASSSVAREAFQAFEGEVVVKPNSATRGKGVVRVEDRDSFRGVVDYLDLLHEQPAIADRSYLVQEFLADATDYRVMVVEGEFVGAVERNAPSSNSDRWKHNVHAGAAATGVDPPARIRRLAEEAAAVLDVPLLGVDLLATGERAVVTETNARPTVDAAEKYASGWYDRLAKLIRDTAER